VTLPSDIEPLLRAINDLADPKRRWLAANALARRVGADELIVFVRDAEIGRSLPAPGFPQTLEHGRIWNELVKRAIEETVAEGQIAAPGGELMHLQAIGLPDGTVLATHGTASDTVDLSLLEILLPMLGALFVAESAAQRAEAQAVLARQSAAQSSELAAKLDTTRADLQRALGVAETATRARDEFLAMVSHELRTPLTSITGWIQLLQQERNAPFVSEGLETIARSAHAQTRLIEDILDFSRINAGKLRLDVRPIEIVEVITAAVEVIRPAADAKGVRIDSVLDPNTGLISGDPDRLQQVVWNLLSNSVKFTERKGRVQIRLERVNSHCEFSVSDTGAGIEPDFLPYVFDRFSQADSTSTRSHGGLGLGLGIVRNLVELHGGTVQAFSPGLGKGATFVVRMPVILAHHLASATESNAATVVDSSDARSEVDLSGVSVLIVEDNEEARRLLTTILNRSGATVTPAENAATALTLLLSNRPDILISDIEMPGEDGYSLIRKIRLQELPSQRTPAIALTAYTRGGDRVRALAAGFQVHIAKPVDPAELVAAVKSLLTMSRGEATPADPSRVRGSS